MHVAENLFYEDIELLESKHKLASVKQLFSISFPLMMIAFSVTLMLLCDRLILSHYSLDALNTATLIGNIYAMIQFAGIKIAYVSEVFVGQYNGSRRYDKVARPVWQMFWFSLALFIITVPLGLYTANLILPEKFEQLGSFYYKLLISTAPLMAITAALSSFYVGRGKIRIVTITVIITNAINIFLDFILILGVKGLIPPMGINGAAYATVISNVVQVGILLVDFLRTHNNQLYKTRHFSFDKRILINCLKIGMPNAVGLTLDIGAWTVLLLILAHLRAEYVTVHSIALTIFLFFNFFIDGLQKGITAIAANIIGAKHWTYLNKLMKSAMILYFSIIFFLLFPLILFPNYTVSFFIRDNSNLHYIVSETITALQFVWVFFIVDGIFWTYTGMLTAAGDTKFLMCVYSTTIFLFLLTPVYIMITYFNVTPSSLWSIISIYKIIPIIFFIFRYKSGKWKKLNLE